jgi:ABC-type nitrate/sulfonate/bicarbonate transport system permease component
MTANKKKSYTPFQLFLMIISIPIFLLAWHLLSIVLGAYRLPSPITIAENFIPTLTESAKLAMAGAGKEGFWPHIVATFAKTTIGFIIGIILGVGTALAMKWFKNLYYLLNVPLDVFRTLPPLAFVPLVFMFFGRTFVAQIAMIVLYSFLTVVINTINAIDNVSPTYQKFALCLGATRGQMYRTVILPAIVPELLGAVRVGIIWAWGYQVIIEMMGAPMGIGKVFYLTKILNALDLIIIAIIWIVILAGIMDFVMLLLFRIATRWQEKAKKELIEY